MERRHLFPAVALLVAALVALLWPDSESDTGADPGRSEPVAPMASDDAQLAELDDSGPERAEQSSGSSADSQAPAPESSDAAAPEANPEEPAPLRCRVVRDGTGVPGCEVALLEGKVVVFTCLTDAEGRFVLPDRGHMGSHNVEIRTANATLRTKGLDRYRKYNGEEERVFHLGHSSLQVTVWGANGEPQPDTVVAITVAPKALKVRYSCRATTDAAGRAVFHDLPHAGVSVNGRCAMPNRATVIVPDGPALVPVDLGPAPSGVPIVVRVLAPDGSGSGSKVALRTIEQATGRAFSADPVVTSDGTYSFHLPPGVHRLECTPPLAGTPMTIEVAPEHPAIELRVEGAVVRGTLEGYKPRYEEPISRFADSPYDVVLRDAETDEVVESARVRDSGTFEFTGIPPGRYVLSDWRIFSKAEMNRVEVAVTSPGEVLTIEGLTLLK